MKISYNAAIQIDIHLSAAFLPSIISFSLHSFKFLKAEHRFEILLKRLIVSDQKFRASKIQDYK